MEPLEAAEMAPDHEVGSPEVGRQIRALRKKRRMSQARLAQRSGLPQYTISRFERGVRQCGAMDLVVLALALETTVDELLQDLTEALRGQKPAA